MSKYKIPISVNPLFWVFAALIGWLNHSFLGAGVLVGTLIWVIIIFLSVLVHELGHAFTAIAFGKHPRIDFIALGGLTSYQGDKLKLWQQFIITFNGPLFGIFLFVFASLILHLHFFENPLLIRSFQILQFVNLFWSIVNLLPVLPLDGGQLLRIIFEGIWGVKGIRYALFVGMIIAGLLSLYFFLTKFFIIGALFFLFAFQAFDTWRKSKNLTSYDRDETIKNLSLKAEAALKENNKEAAKKLFEEVLAKAKSGIVNTTASQYLAFLYYEEKNVEKAYQLLLPHKGNLTPEALCLLHRLAFIHKNYELVAELSTECYQAAPTQEVAIKNAKAFACLKKGKFAGGWLQTAFHFGNLSLEKILNEEVFQSISNDQDFQSFVKRLK